MSDPFPITAQTPRGSIEYAAIGEGPTVLALHGAMGGWDQSLILARTIGVPGFRMLALSRPGYLGTALDVGRSPEEQADRYAQLLDTLGIERAAVMAVSGGGPSAIHFALRHPDRCWALVLVSTMSGPSIGRLPLLFHLVAWLGRRPWFAEMLRRRSQRDLDRAAQRSIRDPEMRARTLADPDVGPLFRALLSSTWDHLPARLDGTINDIQIARSYEYPLEQLRAPALVVHGTLDRVVPFAQHGQALATRIPGVESLVLEGGEHVAIFTHRELARGRVGDFLRAHAPANG